LQAFYDNAQVLSSPLKIEKRLVPDLNRRIPIGLDDSIRRAQHLRHAIQQTKHFRMKLYVNHAFCGQSNGPAKAINEHLHGF
jgi:hypothetical protein